VQSNQLVVCSFIVTREFLHTCLFCLSHLFLFGSWELVDVILKLWVFLLRSLIVYLCLNVFRIYNIVLRNYIM
jgi:hypothetical protein